MVADSPSFANDSTLCNSGTPEQLVASCTRIINSRRVKGSAALSSIYYNRGVGFDGLGEYEMAIRDYTETIQLWPTGVAFSRRGSSYHSMGKYDEAIADYNRGMRLDPKASYISANRGNSHLAKGDIEQAIDDYNRAISLSGSQPAYRAHFLALRGEAKRLRGDLDEAIVDLNSAIKSSPTGQLFYVYRGNVYRYKGDIARALVDFNKALALAPDFVPAFTGRGLAYEKLGDIAKAKLDFEKAVSLPFVKYEAKSYNETARARLAALASGAPIPTIPSAPSKAAHPTSIPTTNIEIVERAQPAQAPGRRVALVIGNSAYTSVPVLANPDRDARMIATSLRNAGFGSVTLIANATRESLLESLRAFANEAESADWAMVYYAGHGIEVNGQNYLIPIDAKLAVDRDVQFEALPLDQLLTALEGAKKLRLVVLDACRDNPFAPRIRRTTPSEAQISSAAGGGMGTRSIGRGLGQVRVQGATLVVFAAKHGQTALDGEGGNSPFAISVAQRLPTPGVELNKLFRLVRDDVMEATAGRQEPYTYGSLPGREDFFFVAN